MSPQVSSWLPTVIAVPLVAFALYRRLRRSFGRQPVTPKRMTARIVLLCVVSVVLLMGSSPTSTSLGAASAGLVLGVALAVVGLRLTTFEVTAAGKFYVPNKWIGLAVTALFLGRLAGRLFTLSERATQAAAGTSPLAGIQRSPLTLGLFFLLAGYYTAYYAGVLKKAGELGGPPVTSSLS